MNKISICTVCMNRLVHLSETLLENVQENKDYPGIEFVVLDYNSPDGLENWAHEKLQEHINTGIVKYYKTYEPQYFDLSHSKNMAIKLATGDVICMVDADNFAGKDYAHWVNTVFSQKPKETIITTLRRNSIPHRDQGGKLCSHRELLYSVRGFDECMQGYGVDDVDLVNRMEDLGGQRAFIEDEEFLRYIGHSNFERVRNYHMLNNLKNIYLMVTDHMDKKNDALFELNDNTFYDVSYEFDADISGDPIRGFAGWKISPGGNKTGTYKRRGGKMKLTYGNGAEKEFIIDGKNLRHMDDQQQQTLWRPVSREGNAFLGMVLAYSECLNRYSCILNKKAPSDINSTGWGRGVVYRNFDMERPIHIS